MPLPFGLSALAEDLCKARFGGLLFIRIVRGGGDELPDHPSRTHEPIVVDTAAMGIAQQDSASLGDTGRVGRRGLPCSEQQNRRGREDWERMHGKLWRGANIIQVPPGSSSKKEFLGRY